MAGKEQRMTSSDLPDPGKAVVLLSGGLDSTTVLAMVREEGYTAYAISFDYHQRHRIELQAAKRIAAHIGTRKHLVVSFDLSEIGGSALTSDLAVPRHEAGDAGSVKSRAGAGRIPGPQSPIPVTYVPARNTIFLSFALAWAEVLQASSIFIGANVMDYSGYPDCRPEYLESFEQTANLATRAADDKGLRFSIKAPLLQMTKAEIISRGTALGIDYGLTWSCYDPQELTADTGISPSVASYGYQPCGACDSCWLRRKGFAEAGIADPLDPLYATHVR